MGEVKMGVCFLPVRHGAKRFCTVAKVDTAAIISVIPHGVAERIGDRFSRRVHGVPAPPAPKDASGRALKGDWYLIGGIKSTDRSRCDYPNDTLVFGQKGRKRAIVGAPTLQGLNATIRMSDTSDSVHCDPKAVARSVGAAANEEQRLAREIKKITRLVKRGNRWR